MAITQFSSPLASTQPLERAREHGPLNGRLRAARPLVGCAEGSPTFVSPSISPCLVVDLRDHADSFILEYLRGNGFDTLADLIDAVGVLDVYCHQAYSETGCIETSLNTDISGFVTETTNALGLLGDPFICM